MADVAVEYLQPLGRNKDGSPVHWSAGKATLIVRVTSGALEMMGGFMYGAVELVAHEIALRKVSTGECKSATVIIHPEDVVRLSVRNQDT